MAHILVIAPIVLPCYLVALKKATGVRLATLGKAVVGPLVAALLAALAAKGAASQFTDPFVQLAAGVAVGGLIYALAIAPQGLALLNEKQSARLRAVPFFGTYERAVRVAKERISSGS
jgi:hypothetical protein